MSEPDAMLVLPIPPSTNNLTVPRRDGKGRANTSAYKAWRKEAALAIMISGCPREGWIHVRVEVEAPFDYRRDIDNMKPIPDILKTMNVIEDDRWIDQWETRRVAVGQPLTVSIWRL